MNQSQLLWILKSAEGIAQSDIFLKNSNEPQNSYGNLIFADEVSFEENKYFFSELISHVQARTDDGMRFVEAVETEKNKLRYFYEKNYEKFLMSDENMLSLYNASILNVLKIKG